MVRNQICKELEKMPIEQVAFGKLLAYASLQWRGYAIALHNSTIAKYLEKVEAGEIDRLMIFTPPRHGKTMLVSEFFPAWWLGRNPGDQIIAATYSFDRAGDIGRKVRNQLVDPMHHTVFPDCKISPDSKGANKLSTQQNGNYYSVGVGGAIVGRGAHLFLIDDPIKSREEAESDTAREKIKTWFQSVAYTRLMPGRNAIVLIMTRWHFDDLAGFLLAESDEKWTVLNMPAIAEEGDLLNRRHGDALWPDSYPRKRLRVIKSAIGSREWNAQFQQNPLPGADAVVKPEWFEGQRYPHAKLFAYETALRMGVKNPDLPFDFKRIICSWDTAFKEKELNDPTACTMWGMGPTGYYLIGVLNKRLEYPKLFKSACDVYTRYKKFRLPVTYLIEDKASGQSLIQDLKQKTNIPIIKIKPENNKRIRMDAATPSIEGGRVWIPDRAPWLHDWESQLYRFPYDRHDDMADSTSQFLTWADKPRFIRGRNPMFWK